MAGQGEVLIHRDAAGPVDLSAHLLGELAGQGGGGDARGPDLGERLEPLGLAGLVLVGDALGVDVDDLGAQEDVHAQFLHSVTGLGLQGPIEAAQDRVRGIHQVDAGVAGVDVPEVVFQGALGQLGQLPGHLHTGGAGPHHDEGHQRLDVDAAALCGGELGELECAEDAASQLQGVIDALHPGGELGELIVPEPGLVGAGCHDQVVVGVGARGIQGGRGDRLGGQVDIGHVAQLHLHVALPGQHLPGGRSDLPGRENAGGHLVEQGLEQVGRRAPDESDVNIGPGQGPGGKESAESRSDDDHSGAGSCGVHGWCLL